MEKELEFEKKLKEVSHSFCKKEESYNVVIEDENYEKFKRIIKKYGISFSVRQSEDYTKKNSRRISWSTANIPFFEVPFVVELRSLLECINGPKKDRTNKNLAKSQPAQHHDHPGKRKRFRLQPSKKKGCNATMEVMVIKQYPDFKLKGIKNEQDEKAEIMKSLKKELDSNAESIRTQMMYHISFSTQSVHCHSVYSNLMNQKPVAEPVSNIDELGESDREIVVEEVPVSESLSLTENSVPTSQIRELVKNVYDRSFLLPSPDCRNSVVIFNKLQDLTNLLNNSIDCHDNIPLLQFSDSILELPRPKKHKKT